MLASPRWSHLATLWDEPARKELVQVWHDLDGKHSLALRDMPCAIVARAPPTVYEDTRPGLTELAKYGIVVTLSNGNYRLLVDMVSNVDLAWEETEY